MIIVIGSFVAKADQLDAALALSLAHVKRSRLEPGCMSHAVHLDAEDPNRLVFLEEWADMAALQTHFMMPDSRVFAKAVEAMAASRPTIQVFSAAKMAI